MPAFQLKGRCFATFALVILVITISCIEVEAQELHPAGFVDVREIAPSIILDIRYYTAHNFVGKPIDGYNQPKCLLTREAAEALLNAQNELRLFGLGLKVYDCYRPQRAVSHFVKWAGDIQDTKTREEFYPTLDKRNLFRDGYIAQRSSHSRGSTVDLTIIPIPLPEQEKYIPGQKLRPCFLQADKRFRDNSIDMGTGFDCFHELSHTANAKVGPSQRINRLLLRSLMEKQGFQNYSLEWWHYTLKNEPFPDTYFDFPVE